jgi:hypothetical protein
MSRREPWELGSTEIQCPACGEWSELTLDPDSSGRMIEDCPVCCRPWQLDVAWDEDGEPQVRVEPA